MVVEVSYSEVGNDHIGWSAKENLELIVMEGGHGKEGRGKDQIAGDQDQDWPNQRGQTPFHSTDLVRIGRKIRPIEYILPENRVLVKEKVLYSETTPAAKHSRGPVLSADHMSNRSDSTTRLEPIYVVDDVWWLEVGQIGGLGRQHPGGHLGYDGHELATRQPCEAIQGAKRQCD